MAWAFVGVSAAVTVTATAHALTEPAGCQAGDLLVAVISSRIASTTSISLPSGWTLVAESKTNNVVAAATTSEASGMMAYIVRGDTAPALTFTHPTAPSVAMGRIAAYRGGNIWSPFDVGVGNKTGTAITAISLAGLTTGEANELIVRGVCSGRASAFSAFDAATDPTTSSGTGSVDTAAPTVGTWRERQDSSTTTGADTALAIADAIRGTAGATGNLTCTASVSGGHVQVSGAFRIEPVAVPAGSPVQWCAGGSNFIDFTASSTNSGTVSSTLDVPTDCELVVVGVQGWCATANYFTNMTFTKSGADTAMTRIGTTEPGNGQTAAIFYLVSPDTGANKSLKFDWAGTGAPGETPLISVTYWKNVDTASPVRSSGASLPAVAASTFKTRSALLTAQTGDLVIGFVGGDCGGLSEGNVDTWYNLDPLVQCTNAGALRHDAAWGTFPPSANLYVGGDTSTTLAFGVCAAIVVKPKPAATAGSSAITQAGSTTQFSAVTGNSGTLSVTVPADAQIAVVGVLGRSDDTGFFDTNLTLTKGAADVAMTRVGPTGQTSAQTPSLYYLALPDTGAGKSLKYNWTGANAPPAGAEPTISVTFWKGVDTASPVRSSGWQGELAERFSATTDTLTAQTGDLVVGFAGGYGPGSEGSIDTWYNLNTLSQWTYSGPHDGAWGTFAPSGNLKVGASKATNLQYGVCAAIVLKPTPAVFTQVGFAYNGNTSGTTFNVTIPATASGDCIIVAGLTQGTYQPAVTITAGGQSVVWGKLGGLTSPRFSPSGLYDFVGIIINPTAGTTTVTLTSDTSGQHEMACWVVRGFTNPVQDVGIWVPGQIGGDPANINLSGLSGTLAVADEFAVSFNQANSNTTSINTSQSGSSGFTADATTTTNFGSGYSHKVCTATTPIQAAWNLDSSGGNCLLATYRSTPPAAPTAPPISLIGFAGRQLFDTSLNLDFPPFTATASGDCIIVAGIVAGSIAGLSIKTPTNEPVVFGTLGGVTSPVLSGSTYNFVGLIANPAVGTTSLNITTTENNSKFLAAWVVRGLTSPVQDKGVWTAAEDEAVATSGLTGTLADANEFAVSLARPPNLVNSINVEQTGSGGFLCDTLFGYFDGGVSHAITESTTQIQAAWNSSTGGADVSLATYRSGGLTPVTGTLDVTDSPDTAFTTFTGTVENRGVLDVTDTADTAAFTGTVAWLAILDATDTADTAAFTGTVEWQGILFATDDPDTAAFTGTVENRGILDATDSPDTADFVGVVLIEVTGILDARDDPDTAAFTGDLTAYTEGILDATDLPDIASFTGTVFTDVTGVLDATDVPDIAAFTGQVISSGILDATDLPDIAAFTGNIFDVVTGILDATEDADTASFISDVTNFGILNVTDSPDIAAFTGEVITSGVLNVTDTPDTADFTGTITAIVPFSQVCIIG